LLAARRWNSGVGPPAATDASPARSKGAHLRRDITQAGRQHEEVDHRRGFHPSRLEAPAARRDQPEAEQAGEDAARDGEDGRQARPHLHHCDAFAQIGRPFDLRAHDRGCEGAGDEPERGDDVQEQTDAGGGDGHGGPP
jgi:hypothetical protein